MTNFKMVLPFLLIGFSTLLASTTEELAHEGEVAFYHQNYIEARKSLIPASQQGDLQSLYYLGILALRGYGTPVDYKEAIRIFREGSQKGHPESQVALAILMIEGIGTPQDYLKASVLLTKAAKQGNSDAQLLLGWLFRNGIGVKENKTISYALWNYVAAQGNDWARINRDAVLYELSEPELYRGQELSSNLPKLWNLISAEHTKMNKYLRKKHG
ncbi:tetratricopeptide repeat protein [Sulfuricurvum sp.]|uniref:tetratricopeptide repeat protein n=1 Tax=Sulfuricurvum sp. TaxID=2025608 RepID=UPI0025FCA2F0|nr:tetratricopeptide repeat protein [Sulfuricurvum sp.]